MVLVSKYFQYQAPVKFPLSNTMTTGMTPLPITTDTDSKTLKKVYCSTTSSADPPKNQT
jgi:hypothetical protein